MLAMALLGPQPAMAHPGHSHRTTDAKSQERTWIAASGAFREHGSFVMARDGQVQIRRADESLVTLPIELLQLEDQQWIERRMAEIRVIAEMRNLLNSDSKATRLVEGPLPDLLQFQELLLAQRDPVKKGAEVGKGNAPEMAKAFEAFVKLKAIKTRWDDRYFYVESNGMPDHQMMVGITSWQQQVPLPQKYTGDNAWQIPLHPVPAKTPASTKDRFLRGAIAVAANGIPIFNPLNNYISW